MTNDPSQGGPSTAPTGEIVATAGRYYRNTRYLMFVILLAMGGWFLYDGFISYPNENAKVDDLKRQQDAAIAANDDDARARIAEELKNYKYHTETSLLIQRLLGFGLPPLGVALLWWALHRSRGEYRLSGTKLSVPGHPTIDLDDIKKVNNDLWDRKGIVWLTYETSGGQAGEIVLDDFIYDRPPTDKIYDVIAEKFGLVEEEEEEGEETDSEGSKPQAGSSEGQGEP